MASSVPGESDRHVVVAFGVSSTGGRENNEDCSLIMNLKTRVQKGGTHDGLDRGVLLVVSDGMGGTRGGEIASDVAVKAVCDTLLDEWVQQERSMLAELENDLNAGLHAANIAVKDRASADPGTEGMGATLTAAVLLQSRLVLGHVGDSRCYISRGDQLKQISTDHTLVEDLIAQGKLTRELAEHHPQRNLLSQAVGLESDLRPQLRSFSLRTGDRVLLCSDGLTNQVGDQDIAGVLAEFTDPELAARELLDRALAAARSAEVEADNITIIVGRLREIESHLPATESFTEKQTRERGRSSGEEDVAATREGPAAAEVASTDHSGLDGREDIEEGASQESGGVGLEEEDVRVPVRESPPRGEVAEGPVESGEDGPAQVTSVDSGTVPVIESHAEDGGMRQLSFVRFPEEIARLPEAIDRGFEMMRAAQRATERALFVVSGVLIVLMVIIVLILLI